MKRKIKCYKELFSKLKENGIILGEPIGDNIYDVISVNGYRVKDHVVCKVFINVPFGTVQSEYTIAERCYSADPEHFMKVYGRPVLFSIADNVFGGVKKCAALLMQKGTPFVISSIPQYLSWYISFLREICLGADTMHRQGIAHLDIKPANVVVNHNGRYCLIDFGISRFVGNAVLNVYDLMGSKYYMAPELFRGILSQACDIYGAGMTVRAILLHQSEQINSSYAEDIFNEKRTMEPLHADSDYIQEFLNIINKMTAFSPQDRYRSMKEVLTDLDHFPIDPSIRLYSAYFDEAG